MSTMPQPGDAAPLLDGPTDEGTFQLAAHAGSSVVVYFYPKDMTKGCTIEAQDLAKGWGFICELLSSLYSIEGDGSISFIVERLQSAPPNAQRGILSDSRLVKHGGIAEYARLLQEQSPDEGVREAAAAYAAKV